MKRSLVTMVSIGLLMRLGSVAYQYHYHLNPALDHWRFGWEMGRVGRAIFEGRGFASPLYFPSGATAWMAPVYPALIALSFKLFGLYTAASALFILSLNALFGALTAIPIFYLTQRVFRSPSRAPGPPSQPAPRQAWIAAWMWTVLPYSIYVCGERIWENTLTTLLAAILLLLTYRVEQDSGLRNWLLWGALWGAAALTSPTLLTTLPFLGLWIAFRHQRAHRHWILPATASALLFFCFLGPWVARNYIVFHRFIPVRDNFWLEVHVGNNGDGRLPCPDAVHPSNSARERQQWAALGELAYMDAKKVESKQWLRAHPGEFLWLTLRRTLFVWTAFWSTSAYYLEAEPMEPFAVFYFTAMTLLAAYGFVLAWRAGYGSQLWPMLWVLIVFPLPYYVTHPSFDYRHAMDPILVILITHAVTHWPSRSAVRHPVLVGPGH